MYKVIQEHLFHTSFVNLQEFQRILANVKTNRDFTYILTHNTLTINQLTIK